MKIKLELRGIKQLERKLARLAKSAAPAAGEAVESLAADVKAAATVNAERDSGELAKSIVVGNERGKPDQTVKSVEATAEHAVFVEYGTEDTSPQPFLRPAIDGAKLAGNAAARDLKRSIESAAK